ncbi:MAG: YebC/PmpR family DNA-binding transcriptional regulator [Chitinophagales bacterium]|jgi:YebC/PmpR family DNA-binding regulatory protein|nr:YebC/PmpR family DNA-binding transcriptional regulator [Sphingobacteriales bacterium]MBP9140059.1 YebC/PmpR family DNA-binding transcriptional regulator [Chitinophagales bacterium]MDA0197859.1 YebC/PmpR family DNA-binding transcriptional regulator [Bacteroidota bacterium]MBK6889920.1 YebC/PmpR family DNA-binding transcriptional regulator [Sphingobacteriales bacterium]MBK8678096.1 YebC/PmpR family DNA-binding transcriptional regulator [Sphingobacteriales bacterium]
MGRAFEFRKERKMKRWDKMAKAFTRIGKEIAIAVKTGGVNPETNSRLRLAIQNAKGANMPKANVEAAIKKASSKDEKAFEEVVYEGYGPHAVAILVETATDNPTRTVANVRLVFNRGGGSLGTSGSLSFVFERKGVFTIGAPGLDRDTLELELIDYGLEEIDGDENELVITTAFSDFGAMQKALEERNIEIINAELQRMPNNTAKLNETQYAEIETLIEKLEDDDDVQNVYHNAELVE